MTCCTGRQAASHCPAMPRLGTLWVGLIRGYVMAIVAVLAWFGIWIAVIVWGKQAGLTAAARYVGGGMLGLLAMILLVAFSSSPQPEPAAEGGPRPTAAPSQGTATPVPAPAPAVGAGAETAIASAARKDEKTLGIPLDQYVRDFNAIGADLQLGVDAHVGEVTPGPVNDVVQISLDEHRKVIIALQRGTRIVKDVTLIGAGDGTPASGITLMASALVAAQAAVPASDRAAVGKAIGRLLGRMKTDAESVHETIGGRRVWMAMSPVTGFMAGVSPGGGK